jgi:hypothetical protein
VHPLVQPHPPTKPWDDAPRHDIPYKNPAYVSPLDNFLWLPRNPLGKLDLDDSVELRRAITTERGGGGLGEWVDETPLVSDESVMHGSESVVAAPGTLPIPGAPLNLSVVSSEGLRRRGSVFSAVSGSGSGANPGRHLTGTEEIVLPPGIRARVPHTHSHAHEEYGLRRRGLAWRRRKGDDGDSDIEDGGERDGGYFTVKRRASDQRRPGLAGLREVLRRGMSSHSGQGQTSASLFSFSPSTEAVGTGIGRSLSTLSRARSMSDRHAALLDLEPALLPDLHAQSPFADPDVGIRVVVTRSSRGLGGPSSATQFTGLSPAATPMLTPMLTPTPGIDGLPSASAAGTAMEGSGLVRMPSTPIIRSTAVRGSSRSVIGSRGGSGSGSGSSQAQITFHEAVVGEVLAEEQVATTKRVKGELEDAGRAVAAARSPWFGWMWKHVPIGVVGAPTVGEDAHTHGVPLAGSSGGGGGGPV